MQPDSGQPWRRSEQNRRAPPGAHPSPSSECRGGGRRRRRSVSARQLKVNTCATVGGGNPSSLRRMRRCSFTAGPEKNPTAEPETRAPPDLQSAAQARRFFETATAVKKRAKLIVVVNSERRGREIASEQRGENAAESKAGHTLAKRC